MLSGCVGDRTLWKKPHLRTAHRFSSNSRGEWIYHVCELANPDNQAVSCIHGAADSVSANTHGQHAAHEMPNPRPKSKE